MQTMSGTNGNATVHPETAPLVALMVGEGRLNDAADSDVEDQEYGAVNGDGGADPTAPSPKKSPNRRKGGWWGQEKKKTNMDEYKTKQDHRAKIHSEGLPRRNCCHGMFIFLSIISILTSLAMIVSKILPLFLTDDVHKQSYVQLAIRCYIAFFSLVFILAELEAPIVRKNVSLQNFISKGFNYTFVAVVAMGQIEATLAVRTIKKASEGPLGIDWSEFNVIFIELPPWIMAGVGLLYIFLGLLCMRAVRDRCREDYRRRMEEFFEAKAAAERDELIGLFVGGGAMDHRKNTLPLQ